MLLFLIVLCLGLLFTATVCERMLVALSGSEVTFLCHSSTTLPVLWSRTTSNSAAEVDIFTGTEVTREFASKFVAQRTGDMNHSLTLLVATVGDSGNYLCIEDEGLSDRRYITQLVVQESLAPRSSDATAAEVTTEVHASTGFADWSVAAIVVGLLVVGSIIGLVAGLIVRKIKRHRKTRRPRNSNGEKVRQRATGCTANDEVPDHGVPLIHSGIGEHAADTSVPADCHRVTSTGPELVRSVKKELCVAAVAYSSAADGTAKLCIAFCNSTTIEVVDNPHLAIKIEHLKSVVDMTGCLCVAGLYIADNGCNCIWRTAPGMASVNCLQLEAPPTGLSMRKLANNRGNLLVSTMSNILRMHDCNLKMVAEIPLPNNVIPLHSIQTPRDTFVVCHAAGVTEFDVNGAELRSFDGRLKRPCYLALNPNDSQIFVADLYGSRVWLLTSELRLVDNFVLEVMTPNRLCYAAESCQLIVGEWETKTVQIFQLSGEKAAMCSCAASNA